MKHSTYTDPITYWSHSGGDIYSQVDDSHIASCDEGEVAPGVDAPALVAAAPQLLDACQEVLRLLDARTGLNVNGISVDTHNIREAESVLKAAIREAKA